MQKRTLKQKCLAWLLSLAVAVTFIPLTAGFAFATDGAIPKIVNLDKANGGNVTGEEIKVTINPGAPWYVDNNDKFIDGLLYQEGVDQKPTSITLSGKLGMREVAPGTYYSVDYGADEWINPGKYTVTVTANEDAEPYEWSKDGNTYAGKFIGEYSFDCTIGKDVKDLGISRITLEYDKIAVDGQIHKPAVTSVKEFGPDGTSGNVISDGYYDVSYTSTSKNAYEKAGNFEVTVTANAAGEAAGYSGSKTVLFSIFDDVTTLKVYKQNGANGTRTEVKSYAKDNKGNWDLPTHSTPFKWGYNSSEAVWTTNLYVPIESLLRDAGIGEKGSFNDKDGLELWAGSTPKKYAGLENYAFGHLKTMPYTADGAKILDKFADESTIPAFLVLDTIDASSSPMMGVGYSDTTKESFPRGFYFCKPVSEVVYVNMNIENFTASVANATYTGKAITPKVTIKDGSTNVPVKITCKNNTNVGTATATINGAGAYYGTITKTFKINKAANTLKVKAKKAPTVKKSKLKKKAQTLAVSKVMTVSKKQGKLTYAKVSGAKQLKIAKTTGKVTVKKKTKKGTYKMKVKVTAAGTKNYKAGSKTVTISVKVK